MRLLEARYPHHAKKFAFVGSAVDLPSVASKDFSFPKLRVVLVARLMPDKGINDFITVAEKLAGEHFEFILIGPASVGFDDLYRKVMEYHRRSIVVYNGECSSEEVQKELSCAHIFYFPSYGEGLSRTMLEAGFACLCPVAYDIPANRDLLAKDRGFLLSVGDTPNVISTLTRLSADRELLSAHAHRYQSFITENYNIDMYTERMDALLQDLFERKSAYGR
jgi:glycosyltransferase involved in cell wall biosynthesis